MIDIVFINWDTKLSYQGGEVPIFQVTVHRTEDSTASVWQRQSLNQSLDYIKTYALYMLYERYIHTGKYYILAKNKSQDTMNKWRLQVMRMKVDPRKSSEHKSAIIKFNLELISLFQNNSISHLRLKYRHKSQVIKECLPAGRGLQDAQCPNEDQLSPWIPTLRTSGNYILGDGIWC